MRVGEICLHDIPHLLPDSTLAEAGRMLRDAAGGVAAVIEDGRLRGTVSERDLAVGVCASGLDPETVPVSRVQDVNPVVCPVDADLRHAMSLMREHRQAWLVLIGQSAMPAGVVSLMEVLEALEPEESSGPEPEYVHRVRGDILP